MSYLCSKNLWSEMDLITLPSWCFIIELETKERQVDSLQICWLKVGLCFQVSEIFFEILLLCCFVNLLTHVWCIFVDMFACEPLPHIFERRGSHGHFLII